MDDYMFIPVIDSVLEMNPTEFEKYALQILQDHIKGLNNVKFIHNKVVEACTIEKEQNTNHMQVSLTCIVKTNLIFFYGRCKVVHHA